MPINQVIAEHDRVHVGTQEAGNRFAGRPHNRLIFIERGIEQNRNTRSPMELGNQLMVKRIGDAGDRLQTTAAIDVGHCRDQGMLLASDREYFLHVGSRLVDFKPLTDMLLEDAGGKRTELLPKFDPQIDDVAHIRSTWIGDQRAIP